MVDVATIVMAMKLAVTGCNGSVGRRVVLAALKKGHIVVGMDYRAVDDLECAGDPNFTFIAVDLRDFDKALDALRGVDAIIHLAAITTPDYKVIVHNTCDTTHPSN